MAPRRLRLVVPTGDPDGVFTNGGELPVVDVEGADDEPTAATAAQGLPTIGLHPYLVDCAVDQTDSRLLGDAPREALVEAAAPPAGWTSPDGWQASTWSEVGGTVADGLVGLHRQRLAEGRGEVAVPASRAAWARPGWFVAARDWIADSMAAAGLPTPDRVVQIRHWGISAILRVDAAGRRWWFKAMFPLFGSEPAVTVLIAELVGAATVEVVAADPNRGWLLLADLGPTSDTSREVGGSAIDAMVSIQRRLAPHRDALAAAGCGLRPLDGIEPDLEAALALDSVRAYIGRHDVPAGLAAAVERVAAAGLPETFVHGDFHPGNVATGDGRVVVFDWSDACFAIPLVDVVTWMWWFEDDPERCDAIWSTFLAAWEREHGVDARSLARADAEAVAAAFHVVSYAHIVEALEPRLRHEHAGGLTHFVGLLERSLGPS